ncbi:N-acyl homoserine lactonase family protein [Streptacidiphilus sp. ASG 303]|uniref:N-acyl homoserine lactonase family protein n=1 Tax=Streptacidiphilus sp. ASG 303 TaxID=2896847 RepID=UPI001E4BBA0C|nr:N-acyl homoserine lactonase family protein [Streptacidiphilus sp. ASG 303]MCD0483658.1 N-acyl homoserine lactonase family protein [Streptacidiphilus sp. ASG 303]
MRQALPPIPAPAVLRAGPDVTVTVFTVGWVAVRPAHREFGGPDALAFPAILAGRGWTPWLPIHAFLVRHPERTVLVDTGDAEHRPRGHYGCGSARQERFHRAFLRIEVPPEAALPRRLAAEGTDPRDVDTVVLTHLHSDHTGNLPAFTGAQVLVGDGEADPFPGSTRCRLPGDGRTTATRWTDGPVAGFDRSHALTPDGTVRAVPLPGHTPGHQGLVVLGGDAPVVVAGDAAFSPGQLRRGRPPGIAADRPANLRTQRLLASLADAGARVLLSHHAPAPGAAEP